MRLSRCQTITSAWCTFRRCRWAILTGEYPPQPGGVADYTRQLAAGLAAAGDAVTVYAPPAAGPDFVDPGVAVRRLADRFGPRGLLSVDRIFARRRPDRIVIQYVPHAFGYKAMNLAFAAWVAARARRVAPVWVMFHEVMYPIEPGQPPRHAVLGRVTRSMARQIARAAERVFVSIPAWAGILRQIAPLSRPAEWLPVPSNIPAAEPAAAAAVRSRVALGDGAVVVGHFGTFRPLVADLLAPSLAAVLRAVPKRVGLLVGRGGEPFRDQFVAAHPDLAGRVTATGELSAAAAAAHLTACDLLLQPYPDGVSTRRGTVMAGLALAVPVVTNIGRLSEPIWGSGSAGVTVVASPAEIAAAAESVLGIGAAERASRGRAAAAWYRERFAPELTVARLRAAAAKPA